MESLGRHRNDKAVLWKRLDFDATDEESFPIPSSA
jgi:hypothetical protein